MTASLAALWRGHPEQRDQIFRRRPAAPARSGRNHGQLSAASNGWFVVTSAPVRLVPREHGQTAPSKRDRLDRFEETVPIHHGAAEAAFLTQAWSAPAQEHRDDTRRSSRGGFGYTVGTRDGVMGEAPLQDPEGCGRALRLDQRRARAPLSTPRPAGASPASRRNGAPATVLLELHRA